MVLLARPEAKNLRHAEERRADGTEERPLPFDRDLQRKPGWYALAEAFARAPARERGPRREHSTADEG